MHHAALSALALYFVMSVRREWAKRFPSSQQLEEELGVPKRPALSVANVKDLLAAVMPLRRFTPEEAIRVVIGHLENRTASTRSRCRKQQQEREKGGGHHHKTSSRPAGGARHK